ncbi:MAG: trehalose-phosphatase, partial [Gemmatimonadaceae bacterium]
MKPEKPAAAPVPSLAPALAPALPPALAERLAGRPFVALLDIDGTLAPIAPRYTHASIPESTRRVVAELASLPGTAVVAVSGRAAADAARMLAVPGTWTIGNHGFELAAPNEPPRPRDDAVPFAGAMTSAADRCRDLARGEAGVIVEDKRWTLSVHYRLAEASVAARVATGAREIAKTLGLRATDGRRVVEIRPPIDVDKGTASVELLRRLGALTPAASVFCAGDDRSDEDTFRRVRSANPRAVAVRVLAGHDEANYESAAELSVSD